MKLDVLLRTHDQGSFARNWPRFLQVPKRDITLTCVASLAASLAASGVEHRVRILDDRSSPETLGVLRSLGEVVPLRHGGGIPGGKDVIRLVRDSDADLVYMVEDDYLHEAGAIKEMVYFHGLATKILGGGQEVALCPYDDIEDYDPRWRSPTRVFLGEKRHWRLNSHTCGTVLMTPSLMRRKEVFDYFDQLATLYGTKTGVLLNICEGSTINNIYGTVAALFTPLPSLAAHLCSVEPPIFDWKALWDHHASARALPEMAR